MPKPMKPRKLNGGKVKSRLARDKKSTDPSRWDRRAMKGDGVERAKRVEDA